MPLPGKEQLCFHRIAKGNCIPRLKSEQTSHNFSWGKNDFIEVGIGGAVGKGNFAHVHVQKGELFPPEGEDFTINGEIVTFVKVLSSAMFVNNKIPESAGVGIIVERKLSVDKNGHGSEWNLSDPYPTAESPF